MQDTNGTEDLLLASMAFFQPVLDSLLKSLEPSSLCEIGIDKGRFTKYLVFFCKEQGCHYTGIDPAINTLGFSNVGSEGFQFFEQKSGDVLPDLPPKDVYIIDGDHNYHTVKEEIRLIFRHSEHRPVLLFHDTAWPFARRDLYYDPAGIPKEKRHPHSLEEGPWPGKDGLEKDGFCATESVGIAKAEGTPCNGVLTAIEDSISQNLVPGGYALATVPIAFGLSILFPERDVPDATRDEIQKLEASSEVLSPLLSPMESNRIRLGLKLLALSEKFDSLFTKYDLLLKNYNDLDKAYSVLMGKYKELDEHSDKLLQAYNGLDQHFKAQMGKQKA